MTQPEGLVINAHDANHRITKTIEELTKEWIDLVNAKSGVLQIRHADPGERALAVATAAASLMASTTLHMSPHVDALMLCEASTRLARGRENQAMSGAMAEAARTAGRHQ